MGTLLPRLPLAILAALLLLVAGSATAAAPRSAASARAYAIKVVVPGQSGAVTASVAAPPDAVAFGGGFAYPGDGSAVSSGAVTASSSANATDTTAAATASSEVSGLVLFGGEITAGQITAKATANAKTGQDPAGDFSGAAVSGLVVLGQAVESTPGLQLPLADWGYATVLAQGATPTADGYRGFVTAFSVTVTADHGGLPAGSQILVGYAEAAAQAAPPPPEVTTTAAPAATVPAKPPAGPPSAKPKAGRTVIPPIVRRPLPSVIPKLTKGGYVFPVHGPASYTDTFGAARAVVSWHHGEDIFAPLGAPVLAVARGTVFSVGWNDIGGNRLWLRDTKGNEFYYAHLSAFSPLAVNGAHVQAGDVLGFVGNTGDAETTPPHLHFEIHPVDLLGLGYDGVINPYSYLTAWRRLEDVRFIAGASWLPSLAEASDAPTPGAFLLSARDISMASGLDPGSLERALEEPVSAETLAPASSRIAPTARARPPASARPAGARN
jgi:murein DD-endopeptidase MepM/ murein hydrolase activator NlpD